MFFFVWVIFIESITSKRSEIFNMVCFFLVICNPLISKDLLFQVKMPLNCNN